jgi:heme oxygenase
MWIVQYAYYDFFKIDSAWYSQVNAKLRADELNAEIRGKERRAWDVKWVRVGDELE